MATLSPYLLGAVAATVCGLDRTAVLQVMISRPLVAAPLTGFLLGDPLCGLTVGALLELLCLSRLPVGASIPHDDTQISVGATVLAVALAGEFPADRAAFPLFCLLVALPLGKLGQGLDRWARQRNGDLQTLALTELQRGETGRIEWRHLAGLGNFALAALLTYGLVVGVGGGLIRILGPFLLPQVAVAAPWLRLVLILVGVGALLRTLHVKSAFRLFTVAFVAGLLLFWGAR